MSTWRESFRPRIAEVIAANYGRPEKEIRAALRLARGSFRGALWPAKIWADEVRVQLGKKTPKCMLRQKRKSDDDTQTPSMFAEPGS